LQRRGRWGFGFVFCEADIFEQGLSARNILGNAVSTSLLKSICAICKI